MAIKLHTVLSDGSPNPDPVIVIVVKHPGGENAPTGATVWARAKTQADWRRVQKAYEEPRRNPFTRQMEMVADTQIVTDALLTESIQSWSGFLGADNLTLACCPASVAAQDPVIKNQILGAIMGAEVVEAEVTKASFREPARVGGVDRRLREDVALLPVGD